MMSLKKLLFAGLALALGVTPASAFDRRCGCGQVQQTVPVQSTPPAVVQYQPVYRPAPAVYQQPVLYQSGPVRQFAGGVVQTAGQVVQNVGGVVSGVGQAVQSPPAFGIGGLLSPGGCANGRCPR